MDEGIGTKLRTLRRWRGMTQAELGGLSGLSESFISMVETGKRPLDRRSHISAVATALQVSESELTGAPHLGTDPNQSDPHLAIPALRVALQTNALAEPAIDRARPLADLLRAVSDDLGPLRRRCDYVSLGAALPGVLDELYFHTAAPADEAGHRLALTALIETCVAASMTAKNLGYPDLAHLAAIRAQEAAEFVDDPVERGKAAYLRILTTPWAGATDRVLALADRAAGALEPFAATPLGIEVLGMLTLTASLAGAVDQKDDVATSWLREASGLAARLPRDEPREAWQSFSSTNVAVWQVTVGVERGLSGPAVLDLANRVHTPQLARVPSRYAGFQVDVGRGLARDPRTRAEAIKWLRRAEATAPQRVRNSAAARETVSYLLNRAVANAGGRELRGMAARLGVRH
ncbi:helix-turn-helix transcriptional regulator [Frankia sp. AgB1.9]|uniref:helix-turn-helix domain-containing protein n=1 Tax=unclassified Frankia TaxID=2632575 RepID=UPI001934B630|nr:MULTISPECIES: helix-turn-helix transcriptional regulator [unclassified Frankia]MBL7493714.1 helix-turn-helix transcriptional regulator [Frankia sp. AgW1.1]MBL7552802.1 helix-turn-helix transcriptional regulator [Frankia sp. AgB1.9]MBL7625392.1 helix-turn-helix transcriptional regulator [Frankia sp. AgB1.8]